MEQNKHGLSVAEAKKIDMVEYLSAIGFEPQRKLGNNHWYHSPLRDEKSPSFKVDKALNLWFDFGEGVGGNLIDFGILYYKCSVSQFLQNLNGNFPFLKPQQTERKAIPVKEPQIIVTDVKPLKHFALQQYIESRKIPLEIANKYCREATYTNGGKSYFAIAFKNDDGGYELRNKYFKNSSSPKGITHIKNGHDSLSVFEGFFDFLSFQTLFKNTDRINSDYLILNSLSFFEKSRPIMESYPAIRLYMDNNTAGQKFSASACAISKAYSNESSLYPKHEDLNDFLCNKPMEQAARQRSGKGMRPS
jgi:hypothetical protein